MPRKPLKREQVIPHQFESLVDLMNFITKYCNENSETFKNSTNMNVVNAYYAAKDCATKIKLLYSESLANK